MGWIGFTHFVGISGEESEEFMFARSRRAVRSARPFPSGPDPGEEEQGLRLVEREPVEWFALRHRIRHLPVFRERRRRDDATVLNPEPLLPVPYPGLANIGDAGVRRVRGLQMLDRRGHSPCKASKLQPAIGFAHDRRGPVGIDVEDRFQIADTVVGERHEIPDRLLVGGQIVEIAQTRFSDFAAIIRQKFRQGFRSHLTRLRLTPAAH